MIVAEWTYEPCALVSQETRIRQSWETLLNVSVARKTRPVSSVHEGRENNTQLPPSCVKIRNDKKISYIYLFDIKYRRYLMLLDEMYIQIIVRIKIFSRYYHRQSNRHSRFSFQSFQIILSDVEMTWQYYLTLEILESLENLKRFWDLKLFWKSRKSKQNISYQDFNTVKILQSKIIDGKGESSRIISAS